jgi:hypothetical protein
MSFCLQSVCQIGSPTVVGATGKNHHTQASYRALRNTSYKLGMVVYTWNPSTQEAEDQELDTALAT